MSYKKHIIDTMKRLYTNKYISIRDGNVSFKPKNENYFYISAGQIRKDKINEDQVIKVNFEKKDIIYKRKQNDKYNLIYDKNYTYMPSREIYMHSYLQTLEENYNKDMFVVHAHPPNIISYTGLTKGKELASIRDFFPELNVSSIGNNVKYFEAGTYDLANNCFQNLKEHSIVALERHGSLSIGNDIDKIFEDIETLEYYIDIELKSKN